MIVDLRSAACSAAKPRSIGCVNDEGPGDAPMTPPARRPEAERWLRIKSVCLEALERGEPERTAFVDRACAGDSELRAEVLSLLAAERAAASFGETPAAVVLDARAPLEPAAPRLAAGTRLGPYELTAFISAGGMGEVYRARHTVLGRDVAIKTLCARLGSADAPRRLIREARHASALHHPNICTIHEVGEADGRPFIVMEYVGGMPLNEIVRADAPPLEKALALGVQIADALEHAHLHGIVHRDLKSSNVVVDDAGRPVVLDFGLARRLVQDGSALTASMVTVSGELAGTLSHMAPEVLTGGEADARTDVWSLGVLLYELTTGKLPFQGRTLFETSSAILHDPPCPHHRRLPLPVRLVLERCLAKDPAARYQRAAHVRGALDAIRRRRAWPLSGRLLLSNIRRTPYRIAMPALLLLAVASTAPWLARRHGAATSPGSASAADMAGLLVVDGGLTRSGAERQLEAALRSGPQAEPISADVFDLYMRGRQALTRFDAGRYGEARDYFVQALARAPAHGPIHAWLSFVYTCLGNAREAGHHAQVALELAPDLPETHVSLGLVRHFYERDAGAEEAYRQAIRLDPGHAAAYHELSMLLLRSGRFEEARIEAQKALYLAPVSAQFQSGLAEVHLFSGRFDEAIAAAERALRLEPNWVFAHWALGLAHRQQGSYERAAEALRAAVQLGCDCENYLANVYAVAGQREAAQQLLAGFERRWSEAGDPRAAFDIALVHAGWGNRAEALAWLERSVAPGRRMLYLRIDPTLQALHAEPRFQALVRAARHPS
jgi:serine/threonine protein kinase/Flp pilus assembly protein TadD